MADIEGVGSGFGYQKGGGTEEGPISAVTEGQASKSLITLELQRVPFLWHHAPPRPSKCWDVRVITQSLGKKILKQKGRDREVQASVCLVSRRRGERSERNLRLVTYLFL